jgi:hypothetical protein
MNENPSHANNSEKAPALFTQLKTIESAQPFSSEAYIAALDEYFKGQYQKPAGVFENFSLGEHTKRVIDVFEKRRAKGDDSDLLSLEEFHFLLGVHDVGKPDANDANDGRNQYPYTLKKVIPLLEAAPYTQEAKRIIPELINTDVIGGFMKKLKAFDSRGEQCEVSALEYEAAIDEAIAAITLSAERAGVPPQAFFDTFLLYYMSDSPSYDIRYGASNDPNVTMKEAGLYHLEVDETTGLLNLKPAIRERMDDLRSRLSNEQK